MNEQPHALALLVQQHGGHIAVGFAVPAWLVSFAQTTLPIVQWVAGILAAIASCYAIAWYRKRLK